MNEGRQVLKDIGCPSLVRSSRGTSYVSLIRYLHR
jgi:hypothetical protein